VPHIDESTGRFMNEVFHKVDAFLHKVAKHFAVTITDVRLTIARDATTIAAEAALAGLYIHTLSRNLVVPGGGPDAAAFEITSTPIRLQARALAPLDLTPASV
jgi:hypothetical protein